MSNKLKKTISNKRVNVIGVITTDTQQIMNVSFDCIVTNDNVGKTLSIRHGNVMFTIPFEPIEGYLT